IFSDVFATALMIIAISGLFIVRGNKGLWGRGGIELAIGILIPLLFIYLI
ncbi:MAG TPA: peptidase, partial [Porphyromonadaceae bacterium]|nr:peptidase [Porphyromonadaceae bacterium]